MNLKPLFLLQKELDQHIIEEKGLEGQDFLEFKVFSLCGEIFELCQELHFARYWSNKTMDRAEALKEYADVLHFFLSIGLDIDLKFNIKVQPLIVANDTDFNRALLHQFSEMLDHARYAYIESQWKYAFACYLGAGDMLGFSVDEVLQAYHKKNEINHERQASGY